MSDKIFKLDKTFGELAASCVRGVRTKSEMEGRICTLLVDLQRYHQNYSKGLEERVKELELENKILKEENMSLDFEITCLEGELDK